MFRKLKSRIKDFQRWKSRHRLFSWPQYGKWVERIKRDHSAFVPFTDHPYQRREDDVKVFAYYLPQFYAIPENDAAYGKGFTEWTNVASAVPHFVGHYQPKIPYDLGFYNLLMPGVMERQVEIAKAYGIYGFCFYYYWFSGKKALEKPLEYFYDSGIDFHYHFCWANENWSKLWDGGNQEVIFEQKFSDSEADAFYKDIQRFLHDSRYEKIGNKPIIMMYRPSLFPKELFLSFVARLRDLAVQDGFDGLFLTCSNHTKIDPLSWGLDGLTEFPPHGMFSQCAEKRSIDRLIPSSSFKILDTSDYIENKKYLDGAVHPTFKACFPGWDNTPRKAWSSGRCFLLSDEDLKRWLLDILVWTKQNHSKGQQLVYINAWNEWAEGAVLEPTIREGYKNLQIVKECLEISRE